MCVARPPVASSGSAFLVISGAQKAPQHRSTTNETWRAASSNVLFEEAVIAPSNSSTVDSDASYPVSLLGLQIAQWRCLLH